MADSSVRILKRRHTFYLFCVLAVLWTVQTASGAETKTRVLFIGNSLTSVNALPAMVVKLAQSRGYNLEVDSYTTGARKLRDHATDPAVLDKISKGKWRFVVLQEEGRLPALSRELIEREVFPYAKKLCEAVQAADPASHVVFYMTMARKNGDPANRMIDPELLSYEGMQRRINQTYLAMAKQNRSLIAPVGEVWAQVLKQYPQIELYGDDVHPSATGTYLSACVIYAVLFKDSAIGLPHSSEVKDEDALHLQEITDQVVKSSEWNWEGDKQW